MSSPTGQSSWATSAFGIEHLSKAAVPFAPTKVLKPGTKEWNKQSKRIRGKAQRIKGASPRMNYDNKKGDIGAFQRKGTLFRRPERTLFTQDDVAGRPFMEVHGGEYKKKNIAAAGAATAGVAGLGYAANKKRGSKA